MRVVDYPYRPSARVFSWDSSYADCLNILLKSYSIMIFILSIIKIMNGRELHPSLDCISNRTLLPSLSSTHLYVSSPLLFLSSQFIACTSPNNATSIMAATGIQLDIANNCTSLSKHQFSLFHFQQHHSWRLETALKEPMGRGHILQCDLTSIYLACASFSSRLHPLAVTQKS